MTKTIILSSGGTGGHVFPALSLATELHSRGYRVMIMTDQRGRVFQQATDISKVIALPVWRGKGYLSPFLLALGLGISFLSAFIQMIRWRPIAVVGFGGYPSVPAVLAAQILRIPTAVHEQNAVLGRANRWVARFVKSIATSFDKVRFTEDFHQKILKTGNPVRPQILATRTSVYPPFDPQEFFRLFIIGGSQGAKIFSDIIPQALSDLPLEIRQRLKVYQQCRPEFLAQTQQIYRQSGIDANVCTFFDDIDQQLCQAHLVIGRAGASTVAELTVVGRPAILVPFAAAMDNHQQDNAKSLADAEAAWIVLQRDFTAPKIQELLKKALENSPNLALMAKNMHRLGQPNAAANLAQMVEELVRP